ncbi:MAG: gliding motility-associated C-terminal domain-containing protein [Saprospiraceae bacterium]
MDVYAALDARKRARSFPKTIFVCALALCAHALFAQSKNGNVWYFGYRAGIDFNGPAPQPLAGVNVDSYEGCAIYCDDQGQPIFYTNGGGSPTSNNVNGYREGLIWNRDQIAVYNMGDTAGGGYSAAQSSLILPQPGAQGRYYVLTMDHSDSPYPNRGLRYFLMDENANGGLGGAVAANVPVFEPAVEALSATPMADGQGYWIYVAVYGTDQFATLPLTASGFGSPIFQPLVQVADYPPTVIKIAPDGRHLACGGVLYRLDAADGNLDFVAILDISNYSFSFSPSGRYLFGEINLGDIVRFDVDAQDVISSIEYVWQSDPSFIGLMQVGPDGAIYVNGQWDEDFAQSPTFTQSVSVIRCPDGQFPDFDRRVFTFPIDEANKPQLYTSLPNFSDHIFYRPLAAIVDTVVLPTVCADSLVLDPMLGDLVAYLWSTGDTTAGIVVRESGDYLLEYEDACGKGAILYRATLRRVDFRLEAPAVDAATFCAALPFTLRVVRSFDGGEIRWSDGSAADTLSISKAGSYSATWTSECGVAEVFYQTPDVNCCRLLTPNAFTPDGDGVNDTFSPLLSDCDVDYAELNVYSRWGELVFQGLETADRWDGLINGRPAASDLYVFTFRYKLLDEMQERFETGQVYLLR